MDLAGFTVLSSPGTLVGMDMEGPSPVCLPLVESQLWASLNAISTILAAVVQSHAEAAIDPSST